MIDVDVIWSGAHNDNDRGGRSMKCPCKRLKFQIFPMVVVLLRLDIDDARQHTMHSINSTVHKYVPSTTTSMVLIKNEQVHSRVLK